MTEDRRLMETRTPDSDEGGPQDRHAGTRGVRREPAANPGEPKRQDRGYLREHAPEMPIPGQSHAAESTPGSDEKDLHARFNDLTPTELSRLAILEPGTRLEQGGVYADLNDLAAGPFKAIGSHEAGPANRYIAKSETDYELWNRLVGRDDEAAVERPATND